MKLEISIYSPSCEFDSVKTKSSVRNHIASFFKFDVVYLKTTSNLLSIQKKKVCVLFLVYCCLLTRRFNIGFFFFLSLQNIYYLLKLNAIRKVKSLLLFM